MKLFLPYILDRAAYSKENIRNFVEIHIRMSKRLALPIELNVRYSVAEPENDYIHQELQGYF